MRVCKNEACTRNINELHGNSKYCIKHQKKPDSDRTIIYRDNLVHMTHKEFKELKRLSEIGKQYEEVNKVIEERNCDACPHGNKCNLLQGRCVYDGLVHDES